MLLGVRWSSIIAAPTGQPRAVVGHIEIWNSSGIADRPTCMSQLDIWWRHGGRFTSQRQPTLSTVSRPQQGSEASQSI
jgi:hypothetical protein